MERSEAVTSVLARVMKMMDRSDGSLLRSISHFEGVSTRAAAKPAAPQLRADIGIEPNAVPALAAAC